MRTVNPQLTFVIGTGGQDQFPVLMPDGFTPVSGLGPSAFAVRVFVNEALTSYPAPVIAEIAPSTGTYLITFQTLYHGQLVIEVDVVSQTFVWNGFYLVVDPPILPGQTYHNTLRDRRGNGLASVVVDVLQHGTSTVLATVETDFDGNYAIPLSDALATPQLVDLRFSGDSYPVKVLSGLVLS